MNGIEIAELDKDIDTFKKENLKYLQNILAIKNISSFDVNYIMSNLNLNSTVISLLKSALEEYDKNEKINSFTTYSEYLFSITRSLETLENTPKRLSKELNEDTLDIKTQKKLLNLIIKKTSQTFDDKVNTSPFSKINFSSIYQDT